MPVKQRIAFLDGLRFVAIGLVMLFHYYNSLPKQWNTISYHDAFSKNVFVQNGYVGVQLFFIISGFVITLSLHNSNSFADFGVKRFSRLFPAMLVCSALTYIASYVGPSTYDSRAINFIPSLTFIDPLFFNLIFRRNDIQWMDGAYWTLFTEVRFYFIASAIYFYDKPKFFRNILLFSISTLVIYILSMFLGVSSIRTTLYYITISNQFPFFLQFLPTK